jgi:hypothetical protein
LLSTALWTVFPSMVRLPFADQRQCRLSLVAVVGFSGRGLAEIVVAHGDRNGVQGDEGLSMI